MACIFFSSQPFFSIGINSLKKHKLHHQYYCCAKIGPGSNNFENRITSSFSYKNSVGVPLNELPWVVHNLI